MVDLMSPEPRVQLEIVRYRIERKASNLDQYIAVLPWFERVLEISKVDPSAEPNSPTKRILDQPQGIDDPEIVAMMSEIFDILESQEKSLEEYRGQVTETEASPLEQFFVFLAPLFITIAAGLALFKALYQP